MKSPVIGLTNKGDGITEAMSMTERIGIESGLDKKSVLHLRLLAEELSGMLRGIAGEVAADYWLESDGTDFELNLKSEVRITSEMRSQFIDASTERKNDAARGFMGKIRVMIASFLITTKEVMPYALMNSAAGIPTGGPAGDGGMLWSMTGYRDEIRLRMEDGSSAAEAWDELEKSIVANIADDVKVGIVGNNVEITVFKSF